MPRNPEYQYFIDSVSDRIPDELPLNLETKATPQEMGWWKQWQMSRAIHHFRSNTETKEERSYLKRHWRSSPIDPNTRSK